jgi:hypothetical protein
MPRISTILLLTCVATPGFELAAQPVSIGLIGGVALTDAVSDIQQQAPQGPVLGFRSFSPTKDWIAGAAFDVRVRGAFSIEVDAMYRELNATWAAVVPDGSLNSVSFSPVVTFEFPVLAKYRFGSRKARPFIEAGPAFRTTGNLNFNPSHHGVAAGFGLESEWHGLKFAPVLRYTRWAQDLHRYADIQSQPSQLELLLGISRATESGFTPFGRWLSLGVTVGWGITHDVPTSTNSSRIYFVDSTGATNFISATETVTGVDSPIVGPALEIHFSRRLSLEANALYKPLREHVRIAQDDGTVVNLGDFSFRSTWRFPVLAKYRFRPGAIGPFIEGGPSFRLATSGLSTFGATAGAGVQFHRGPVHIAPGVRYTRWQASAFPNGYARNEVAVLTGVLVGGSSNR